MAYRKVIAVYRIFITFTACFSSVSLAQRGCDQGWFGDTCQFQCHCADSAGCSRDTGACASGGCHSGWFGPGCQYDVSEFTVNDQSGSSLSWLTDTNEQTCNDGTIESVTVSHVTPHPLTWIRVVVSDEGYLNQYKLDYRARGSRVFLPRPETRSARVDDRTLDISCPTSQVISHVTLSGAIVRGMCSLYISGGRNVALKQPADQSSIYKGRHASLAVDGDPGGSSGQDFRPSACTHTDPDGSSGWWTLAFSRPVEINKILIYNRLDCCKERLSSFLLQAFSSPGSDLAYTYTGPGEPYQDVYTVLPLPGISVTSLRIQEGYSGSSILTLCEVYVFGESVCSKWNKFGFQCERQCNCAVLEACFVSTGGCPSGCAPGYTGEDCYTRCEAGKYGQDCNESCSEQCYGGPTSCHHVDGACRQGCEEGYLGPLCEVAQELKSGDSSKIMYHGVIGGLIAAFLVFDAVAVAVYFYIRRRRRRRRQLPNENRQGEADTSDREVADGVVCSSTSQPRSPTADVQAEGGQLSSEAAIARHVDNPYESYDEHYDILTSDVRDSGVYANVPGTNGANGSPAPHQTQISN